MRSERMTRHVARWVVVGAVASGVAGLGGCLQILGDDGTFIERGTGGGGTGGTTGGTGGVGATGGGGTGTCMPDDKQACYTGPQGTEGIGNCNAGEQTCAKDGLSWGVCEGEVTPMPEVPSVVGDEECDGYAPGEAIWSAIYGDSGSQSAAGVAVDPSTGDVILVGTFNSAIQIGNDMFISKGGADVFLARFDALGHPLWAMQIGAQGDQKAQGIALGTDGSIAISGFSSGAWMPQSDMLSAGLFVLRFDATGGYIWGRGCGGGDKSKLRVAVGSTNQVVVAGSYTTQANCGDQAHAAVGGQDVLVAWFDPAGGPALGSVAAGDGVDQYVTELALDAADNILLVGVNHGTFSLGGDSLPAFGNQASFVAKLAPGGAHLWSHYLTAGGDIGVTGCAVDALGGLVIGGAFAGKFSGVNNGPVADGLADAFVARLNAGGDFTWVKNYGGVAGSQFVVGVAVDGNDDIALVGAYFENLDFDGEMLPEDIGWIDGYVAKVAGNDGSPKWIKSHGRISVLTESTEVLAVTSKNFVVVAGGSEGALDLGNGPLMCKGGDAFAGELAP